MNATQHLLSHACLFLAFFSIVPFLPFFRSIPSSVSPSIFLWPFFPIVFFLPFHLSMAPFVYHFLKYMYRYTLHTIRKDGGVGLHSDCILRNILSSHRSLIQQFISCFPSFTLTLHLPHPSFILAYGNLFYFFVPSVSSLSLSLCLFLCFCVSSSLYVSLSLLLSLFSATCISVTNEPLFITSCFLRYLLWTHRLYIFLYVCLYVCVGLCACMSVNLPISTISVANSLEG